MTSEMDRMRVLRDARRRLDTEARGPMVPPALLTLRDLTNESDPPLTWRIDGWQPAESRVILAAPRKAGKTTLVGSLVRSLVDGDPWLGHAPVRPTSGAVAILDTEMSRSQLRRWLIAQRIVRLEQVIVVPLRGQARLLDFLDPACRARWRDWLRPFPVEYVIVDCLRPILDALGLDESHEAGRWLVGFDAFLREASIPDACLVHHMGHTQERSRGDSRLRDWPDVEWRVTRERDDDQSPRYIAAYGRDVDVAESRLSYHAATRRLTLVGGSREEARACGALEAVVALVRTSSERLSGRGIKEKLGKRPHSKDAIDAALRLGLESGVLACDPGPRKAKLYRVSECPALSDQCSPDTLAPPVSECPSAYMKADTPDTAPLSGTVTVTTGLSGDELAAQGGAPAAWSRTADGMPVAGETRPDPATHGDLSRPQGPASGSAAPLPSGHPSADAPGADAARVPVLATATGSPTCPPRRVEGRRQA